MYAFITYFKWQTKSREERNNEYYYIHEYHVAWGWGRWGRWVVEAIA